MCAAVLTNTHTHTLATSTTFHIGVAQVELLSGAPRIPMSAVAYKLVVAIVRVRLTLVLIVSLHNVSQSVTQTVCKWTVLRDTRTA